MQKFLCALVLVILFSQICFAASLPNLTEEQRSKVYIIGQVKLFEKSIGLEETDNFTRFDNADGRNKFLCIAELACMPFSMHDPQMIIIYGLGGGESREDFISVAKRLRISNYDDYDYLFVEATATAGDSPITKKLLDNNTPRTLAEVVIHEDFHNNLPMCADIGEAAARLVGIVGACKFFKFSRDEEDLDIAITKNSFDKINEHYGYFSKLCELYHKGKISRPDFLRLRFARFGNRYLHSFHSRININDHVSVMSNVLGVSLMHTYSNYFPLMLRLYVSLDRDLAKFIDVLRVAHDMWPSPNYREMNRETYFRELRRREDRIAEYIESVILANDR